MPTPKTNILLADDHDLFAEGLRYIIENLASDMKVVGIAKDGKEALDFAREHDVDIVLLDVRMPGMDGVEAALHFHLALPDVKVVMLTTFDDDEYVHYALRNGAMGYLIKSMPPRELVDSIRAVRAGNILIDSKVRASVSGSRDEQLDHLDSVVSSLKNRERDVLELVLEANSNQQIADQLNISYQSVRNYVSAIYLAFDVKDRFELIQLLKDAWPYIRPQ